MFDTPQEAALKAENERLRAENAWLRNAVEAPNVEVTPYAAVEDIAFAELPRNVTLPLAAGVRGRLQDEHRWHVQAWQTKLDGGRYEVSYYCPSWRAPELDDHAFANVILPKLHEKFIRQLSDIFRAKTK